MPIRTHIDEMMARRGVSLTEMSERVGISMANMSHIKTGKIRSLRISTLEAICRELHCTPGDLITYDD